MGTVIQLMGKHLMPATMPWQEKNPPPRKTTADNGIRGIAKRRLQAVLLNVLESIDPVKTTASYHANCRFCRINASHDGFMLPFNGPRSSVINAVGQKDSMTALRLIL